MSRLLVWMLGGGTALAGAAVAGWIVLDQQRAGQSLAPEPEATTVAPATPPVAGPEDAGTAAVPPVGEAPQIAAAPEPVPPAADAPASEGTPVTAAPEIGPTAPGSEESAPAAPAGPPPPTFDVVRVARDGAALVAGAASPGAAVTLRVDDVVVAQTAADPAGQFVVMFDLGASESIQVMTLEMAGADGVVILSEDTVILTPRPAIIASAPSASDPDDLTPQVVLRAGDAGIGATADGAATLEIAALDRPSVAPGDAADRSGPAGIDPDAPRQPEGAAPAQAPTVSTNTVPQPADLADPDQPASRVAVEGAPQPDPASAEPAGAAQVAAAPLPAPVTPLADPAIEDGGIADAGQPVEGPVQDESMATLSAAATPAAQTIAGEPSAETQLAQAEDMPTAFIVRGGGSVEVIGAAPQVMDNVVIDSISYSATGDVQIAGRAARTGPDASLRIYLNNQPIAVAQAERGGWVSDLPQVDPGVYTLRVDQLNAQGGVVSRFETPFQREDPDLVARAQARMAEQAGQSRTPSDTPAGDDPVDRTAADSTLVAAAQPSPDATAAAQVAGETASTASDLSQAPVTQTATAQEQDSALQTGTRPATTAPQSEDATATAQAAPQANQIPAPATRSANTAPVPPVSLITVQPGHTLWAISRERYGVGELYVVIYRANRSQIRDPDLIYPGQIFELPDG